MGIHTDPKCGITYPNPIYIYLHWRRPPTNYRNLPIVYIMLHCGPLTLSSTECSGKDMAHSSTGNWLCWRFLDYRCWRLYHRAEPGVLDLGRSGSRTRYRHAPQARAAAHFWVQYLEGEVCRSRTRTQLNHQLQRCDLSHCPGATPCQSLSLGERKERRGALEGELEEKPVCTITSVGAAVVRLIHPRLPR